MSPGLSLKLSLLDLRTDAETPGAHRSGTLIQTLRFSATTTIPATDWRTSIYSHVPASTYLVDRALGDAKRAQI